MNQFDEFIVYITRNESKRLYIGQTKRIYTRLKEHGKNHGSIFNQNRGKIEVIYTETYSSLKAARQREQQLKKWSKAKKEALIKGDIDLLKSLSNGRVPRRARDK